MNLLINVVMLSLVIDGVFLFLSVFWIVVLLLFLFGLVVVVLLVMVFKFLMLLLLLVLLQLGVYINDADHVPEQKLYVERELSFFSIFENFCYFSYPFCFLQIFLRIFSSTFLGVKSIFQFFILPLFLSSIDSMERDQVVCRDLSENIDGFNCNLKTANFHNFDLFLRKIKRICSK